MAKILNYYALCPINDVEEFLGLSPGAEPGTVINTLGRNIISTVKLNNQKQINSWTSLEKFTNKVVYDCKTKEYVGVFANKWIRSWSQNCIDINKIKKLKLAKAVQDLIPFDNRDTIVLYNDGTCESLKVAIDTRKDDRDITLPCHKPVIDPTVTKIIKPTYFQTSDGRAWLVYFTKSSSSDDIYFVRLRLEPESLQILDTVTKFKIARDDQSAKLAGYAVVDGILGANLVTIWNDRRMFQMALRDDHISFENAPGHFSTMLHVINVNQPLSVIGVNKDCIAIYGGNSTPQEGGSLLLFNTQFNVVESKQYFKIYFTNSRLWSQDKYIFLAYGQTLAVVQFRMSKEQLSDMVGSQRIAEQRAPIDTECINVDGELEDMLRFDPEPIRNHISTLNNSIEKKPILQNGTGSTAGTSAVDLNKPTKSIYNEDTFDEAIRNIYQYDIDISVIRDSTLPPGILQLSLSSNINDMPFTSDVIQFLTAELERTGFSEMAITEYVIPILIKADLADELVTCLRKYTNISEKWLVEAIKYFVQKQRASIDDNTKTSPDQKLNAALSCSFNEEEIREHIRDCLQFDDVLFLLNYIYEALKSENVQLEERPEYGDSFDDDQLLVKWFIVIIDAYFHQFVMSRKKDLVELFLKWKELIDNYLVDLQGLKSVEALLINLIDGKSIRDKHGSKWYSIEEVKLY